jgi:hypothetical protein
MNDHNPFAIKRYSITFVRPVGYVGVESDLPPDHPNDLGCE